jgi:8-oxo-dGTP diphosphatase
VAASPAVMTSVVVFTIRDRELKVLLVRRPRDPFRGRWSLPGGGLGTDEDLETSAVRKLREKAGVAGVYLEQLYTFGRPDRDPRARAVAVAYYALVPPSRLQQRPVTDAESVNWFPLQDLPELAFDHEEIVDCAHRRLVAKLDYSTIAYQFMPEDFTLSQLQAVYEIILRATLDKRNFRKRVLALGHLVETGSVQRDGSHRPARLYRVRNPNTVEFIR